jgi:hypothetical protein
VVQLRLLESDGQCQRMRPIALGSCASVIDRPTASLIAAHDAIEVTRVQGDAAVDHRSSPDMMAPLEREIHERTKPPYGMLPTLRQWCQGQRGVESVTRGEAWVDTPHACLSPNLVAIRQISLFIGYAYVRGAQQTNIAAHEVATGRSRPSLGALTGCTHGCWDIGGSDRISATTRNTAR